MQLNLKVFLLFCLFLGVSSIVLDSQAVAKNLVVEKKTVELPKTVLIDGKRYEKNSVIGSFLDAAFSKSLWFQHSLGAIQLNDIANFSQSSFPKHHVVNKWKIPIIITIILNNNNGNSELPSYLNKHMEEIIPIYQTASGINFTYSNKEHAANFHIHLNQTPSLLNAFKSQQSSVFRNSKPYDEIMAVRFTPFIRSQVEGFFIPNAENEIEQANCYINSSILTEDLTKALISECLARGLGLPELSTNNKGILSNWNSDFDSVSELAILDGINRKYMAKYWKKLFHEKLSESIIKNTRPNEFDLKLISILYCTTLLTGMDKYSAISTILNDESCNIH